ncbi:MAG: Na+/H+ antiporter NhaA, partial [Chloroflexota bacterium]|nr:Na+/H+ antiporter NhaA [Dehalococcoidia bacterium]MDW8047529.1 Na+/H+ antiporter NhaA [Chloroflexota bacterium]
GVALGLFLGKPVGILTATFLAVRLGIGALPSGARWTQIAGVGLVAGIGFTVSLFITGLAFDPGLVQDEAKMGILAGSFLSGVVGYTYLRFVAARSDVPAPAPAPEGAPGR